MKRGVVLLVSLFLVLTGCMMPESVLTVILDTGLDVMEIKYQSGDRIEIPEIERKGYELLVIKGDDGKYYLPGEDYEVRENMKLTWKWVKLHTVKVTEKENQETYLVRHGDLFTLRCSLPDVEAGTEFIDDLGNYYKDGEQVTIENDIEFTWVGRTYNVKVYVDGSLKTEDEHQTGIYVLKGLDRNGYATLVRNENGFEYKYVPRQGAEISLYKDTILNVEYLKICYVKIRDAGEDTYAVYPIVYGNRLDVNLKKDGFSLEYIEAEDGSRYRSANDIVVRDSMTLTCHWHEGRECLVSHEGWEFPSRTVAENSGYVVPRPEGYVILDIQGSDGKKYHPGDEIMITEDFVLTWNIVPVIPMSEIDYYWRKEGFVVRYESGRFPNSLSYERAAIPAYVEGFPVVELDNNSFYANFCDYIYIPDTVRYIDAYAFKDSRRLVSIHLPQRLEIIGTEAFCNTPLKELKLPGTVREIASRAFAYSAQIKEITIPASVLYIGPGAFAGWNEHQTIILKSDPSRFDPDWNKECAAVVKEEFK